MKCKIKRTAMYKLLCLSVTLMFCISGMAEPINQYEAVTLSHVKGCQSVGIRAGHGTKNIIDFGLTYAYCFNTRMSLLVELDHERASFGHTDFKNVILVSPGFEHNLINSTKWFYWHWLPSLNLKGKPLHICDQLVFDYWLIIHTYLKYIQETDIMVNTIIKLMQ